MILKNRSPVISITDEDISELTDRFDIVYAVGEDPDAIQPPPDAITNADPERDRGLRIGRCFRPDRAGLECLAGEVPW
jgi:hypothetical protein